MNSYTDNKDKAGFPPGLIWGYIVTVIFMVGDGLEQGWRNTVMWNGSVGCGVASLVMLYTPQVFGHNFWMLTLAGVFYGAALTGYVPISAIVTSLAPTRKALLWLL